MSGMLALLVSLVFVLPAGAQVKAFPSAEGFGANASGGRGGVVIPVTNLNDAGAGSLRACAEVASGPRTCVFRVAGDIHLETGIKIIHGDLTIAGQTAPGDGVQIRGRGIAFDADNVIMRHLRIRPGLLRAVHVVDALQIRQAETIIIDHVSTWWANDGNIDVTSTTNDHARNVTVQWSIMSEPFGGQQSLMSGDRISMHHNIFAHSQLRNPASGMKANISIDWEQEMINNLIFDYQANFITNELNSNAQLSLDVVGNIYINTSQHLGDTPIIPTDSGVTNQCGRINLHHKDNISPIRINLISDESLNLKDWCANLEPNPVLFATRINNSGVTVDATNCQYSTITSCPLVITLMAEAGQTIPVRDDLDARLMTDIFKRRAVWIGPNSGIPPGETYPTLASGTPPTDTDGDGMPDTWETGHKLNPTNANDGRATASNGYTHLENYLNELAGDGAGTPPPPSNVAPVVSSDAFAATVGTVMSGDVSLNDADQNGDPLIFTTLSSPILCTNFVFEIATGTFACDAPTATGSEQFTYQAHDGQATSNSTTVTLTYTASPGATVDPYPSSTGVQFDTDSSAVVQQGGIIDIGTPVLHSQTTATATFTKAVTVPAGNDRVLLVFVMLGERATGATAFSTMTRDGQALSLLTSEQTGSGDSLLRVEAWGLLAPNVGTSDLVGTMNDVDGSILGVTAIPLTGVSQAALPTNVVSVPATNAQGIEANITTTGTDSVVLSIAGADKNTLSFTLPSPQVEVSDTKTSGGTMAWATGYQFVASPSTVLTQYNTSILANRLALIAVALLPSGSGAAGSLSVTHTVGAGLTNDMLLVLCGTKGAPADDLTIAGITWEVATPQAFTLLARQSHQNGAKTSIEAWYLLSPENTTDTILVDFTATPDHAGCVAYSVSDAKQATPLLRTFKDANNVQAVATTVLDVPAGAVVLDLGMADNELVQIVGTEAQRASETTGAGGLALASQVAAIATARDVTFEYQLDQPSSLFQHFLVAIEQPPGLSNPTYTFQHRRIRLLNSPESTFFLTPLDQETGFVVPPGGAFQWIVSMSADQDAPAQEYRPYCRENAGTPSVVQYDFNGTHFALADDSALVLTVDGVACGEQLPTDGRPFGSCLRINRTIVKPEPTAPLDYPHTTIAAGVDQQFIFSIQMHPDIALGTAVTCELITGGGSVIAPVTPMTFEIGMAPVRFGHN